MGLGHPHLPACRGGHNFRFDPDMEAPCGEAPRFASRLPCRIRGARHFGGLGASFARPVALRLAARWSVCPGSPSPQGLCGAETAALRERGRAPRPALGSGAAEVDAVHARLVYVPRRRPTPS